MRNYYAISKCILPNHFNLNTTIERKAYCGLSLSNPNYYGKRLEAVVNYCHKNFNQTLFITTGYLYRYNYLLLGHSQTEADLISKTEEEDYITQELSNLLDSHDDNKLILCRWSDLVEASKFRDTHHREIQNFYQNNSLFRTHLQNSALDYVNTKIKKHSINVNKDIAIELCIKFLLEELGIFNYLVSQGYNNEVYPGKILPVLDNIINMQYADPPPSLINRCSIEIALKKQGRKGKGGKKSKFLNHCLAST